VQKTFLQLAALCRLRFKPQMCIFIKPVREVRETRILVGPTSANRALTIYENFVGIDEGNRKNAASQKKVTKLKEKQQDELQNANAMILPAPLLDESNAIELLDLSKGMSVMPL
jgi:hypothetical protein